METNVLDTDISVEEVLARMNLITGKGVNARGVPRRCRHGAATNQRCDDCHRNHSRWFQLEIPDKSTTTLVRYVDTQDGPQYSMSNISRVQTAWFPHYLEEVDFRPIWGTWHTLVKGYIASQQTEGYVEDRGLSIDSFDEEQLKEMWALDTKPLNAALLLLSR